MVPHIRSTDLNKPCSLLSRSFHCSAEIEEKIENCNAIFMLKCGWVKAPRLVSESRLEDKIKNFSVEMAFEMRGNDSSSVS